MFFDTVNRLFLTKSVARNHELKLQDANSFEVDFLRENQSSVLLCKHGLMGRKVESFAGLHLKFERILAVQLKTDDGHTALLLIATNDTCLIDLKFGRSIAELVLDWMKQKFQDYFNIAIKHLRHDLIGGVGGIGAANEQDDIRDRVVEIAGCHSRSTRGSRSQNGLPLECVFIREYIQSLVSLAEHISLGREYRL